MSKARRRPKTTLLLVAMIGLSLFDALFATGRIFMVASGAGLAFGIVNLVEFLLDD